MRRRELRGRRQSGNVDFDVVDPHLHVRLIHGQLVAVTSAVVVARNSVQVETGDNDVIGDVGESKPGKGARPWCEVETHLPGHRAG